MTSNIKKESSLHDKIKKWAESRGHYVIKIWGGGFQESGIPDLILNVDGLFIGMEVKIGNGKPSPLQCEHVLLINESGGVGCIVWDFKAAQEVIWYCEDLAKAIPDHAPRFMDEAQEMYKKYVKE